MGGTALHYAYKASLVGAAHQFELTEQGLSWRIAGRSGLWPYADIASVRLSYRPVSMQSRRFRADIGKMPMATARHSLDQLADRGADGAAGQGLSRLHHRIACAAWQRPAARRC